MEALDAAQSLGFTMPTPAYLFGAILFGLVGLAAFRFGKKAGNTPMIVIALGLMLYPYAVSSTWLLYGVGAALCGALWWYRAGP